MHQLAECIRADMVPAITLPEERIRWVVETARQI